MKPSRRAVIDVGTNSIKLLVADVIGSEVKPIWEESKQTRLGKGFYEQRRLQPETISTTAEAVAKFAAIAREHAATTTRVIATSAARDAINGHDLTDAIKLASGLEVEVISGEQEAEWVFKGVTSSSDFAQGTLLLLDIGGGSSEFIVGHHKNQLFAESFALGTVRMLERFPHSEPPTAQQFSEAQTWVQGFLAREVEPRVAAALERASHSEPERTSLIATGGTATILARMEAKLDHYDRQKIETTRLTLDRMKWHVEHLWKLPLEQRKQIPGLPKNRADVILMGALICEAIMEVFRSHELRISTRGLRFAAIMG